MQPFIQRVAVDTYFELYFDMANDQLYSSEWTIRTREVAQLQKKWK